MPGIRGKERWKDLGRVTKQGKGTTFFFSLPVYVDGVMATANGKRMSRQINSELSQECSFTVKFYCPRIYAIQNRSFCCIYFSGHRARTFSVGLLSFQGESEIKSKFISRVVAVVHRCLSHGDIFDVYRLHRPLPLPGRLLRSFWCCHRSLFLSFGFEP